MRGWFSGPGVGVLDTRYLRLDATNDPVTAGLEINGVVIVTGIGGSGLIGYDLLVGDTTTPDYGLIRTGDASFGRVPYNAMGMDLDGAVIIRNLTAPATSNIEFAFLESGGTSVRFALAKAAVGNATYNPRSMLIAGPSVWDDEIVTVGYWQTNNNIFDNLACDTDGPGADLGVQNDLEVEGDIFTDSIKESTTNAGVSFVDTVNISVPTATERALILKTTDDDATNPILEIQDSAGNVFSHALAGGELIQYKQIVAKTGTYTATVNDEVILCNSNGGAFTITLPASSGNAGLNFHIKKTDSSGNAVTIDGNSSETIDDDLTVDITSQYESLHLVCDGANWHVL